MRPGIVSRITLPKLDKTQAASQLAGGDERRQPFSQLMSKVTVWAVQFYRQVRDLQVIGLHHSAEKRQYCYPFHIRT
jgi:hypothetical protein